MSRHSKGPRLYLRTGRIHPRTGQPIPDIYYIRDGSSEVSTGCGPDRLGGSNGAEAKLAAYIASKWTAKEAPGASSGDPTAVLISDVVALYARERAPNVADPVSTAIRLRNITLWWAGKSLGEIKRSSCQAYVAHRCSQSVAMAKSEKARERKVTPQGVRRELEDLSAAIGYWCGEHTLTIRPKVWMPEKKESPRDALTRHQAARLLMAARGRRWDAKAETWIAMPGRANASRAHLRRFLLIGLYTGTRPGVIPNLLWHESPTQAYVDLRAGVIYRRGKEEAESRTKRRPLVRLPARLTAHMRRWEAADLRLAKRRAAEDSKAGAEARPRPLTVLHHGWKPIGGRIRKGFATLVSDAGLDQEITPHWMRHTCATWLMENDTPIWDAAAYTGMTAATLERVYAHARSDHQAKARRAITGRK